VPTQPVPQRLLKLAEMRWQSEKLVTP
jgi:hypothetical protein